MSVPFFTKSEYLGNCVFDLDDLYAQWDRNALSELFWLKTKYPKLKVTLFTVPDHPDTPLDEMRRFIELLNPHGDWIQLACHGLRHETPMECSKWTEKEMNHCLDVWEDISMKFVCDKGFKAPGWQISRDCYKVLKERDYWVADHTTSAYTENGVPNKERRPEGMKVYDVDHPWIFHGHTWDLPNEDPAYQNGIRQMFQVHKLPWDQETTFHFIGEVI